MDVSQQQFTLSTPNGAYNVIFPNVKAIIIEERRKDNGLENGRNKPSEHPQKTLGLGAEGEELCTHKGRVQGKMQNGVLDWSDAKLLQRQNMSGFCNVCCERFNNIHQHTRSYHTEPRKKYICELCEKELASYRSLKSHMETHEGRKPRKCSKCDKVYFSQTGFEKHLKKHAIGTVKPFLCTICGKSYGSQFSFVAHTNSHTGVKPYECGTCGMKFTYGNVLRDHMTTHTGEKPHKCPNCDQAFATRNGVKSHIKYRHKEKRFECEKCGHKCAIKSDLTKHLRTHGIGETKFPCSICKKVVKCPQYLRDHMKIHAKHVCEVCGEQCASLKDLKLHQEKFANQEPLSCSKCNKLFHEEYILRKHITQSHEQDKDQEKPAENGNSHLVEEITTKEVMPNEGVKGSGSCFETILEAVKKHAEPSGVQEQCVRNEKVDGPISCFADAGRHHTPVAGCTISLRGGNMPDSSDSALPLGTKMSGDMVLNMDDEKDQENQNLVETELINDLGLTTKPREKSFHGQEVIESRHFQVFQNADIGTAAVGKQSQGTQTIKTSDSEDTESSDTEGGLLISGTSSQGSVLHSTQNLLHKKFDHISSNAVVITSSMPQDSPLLHFQDHFPSNIMRIPNPSCVQPGNLQRQLAAQCSSASDTKFHTTQLPGSMMTEETGYLENTEGQNHFSVSTATKGAGYLENVEARFGVQDPAATDSQITADYLTVSPSTTGIDSATNYLLGSMPGQGMFFAEYIQNTQIPSTLNTFQHLPVNSGSLPVVPSELRIDPVVPHQLHPETVLSESLAQPTANGLTSINCSQNSLECLQSKASIAPERPGYLTDQSCTQSLPHADVLLSRSAVKLATKEVAAKTSYEQNDTHTNSIAAVDPKVYLVPERASSHPHDDAQSLRCQTPRMQQSSDCYHDLPMVNCMPDVLDYGPDASATQQQNNTSFLDQPLESTPCELENFASINVFDQYSIPPPPPTLFPTQIQSWQISTLDHTLQFTFPDEASLADLDHLSTELPEIQPSPVRQHVNLDAPNLTDELSPSKPPPEAKVQTRKRRPRIQACKTCGKREIGKQKRLVKGNCEACQQDRHLTLHCNHHLTSHLGNVSLSCTVCVQENENKKNSEINSQSKKCKIEKKFKCGTCKKKFRLLKYLKSHERTHSFNVSPRSRGMIFACDICGHCFETWNFMKLHLSRHENSFFCDICHEIFEDKDALSGHKKSHEGVIPTTCGVCGRTFHRKNSASEHMSKHAKR